MGNIVGLDLNIDQNYLENAVKQTVMMGISESLNGKNEIVSQIVKMVLSQKVNERGQVSNYSSDNKYTLLEVYVKHALTEEVRSVLKQMVEEKRPEIHQSIRKELAKKKTVDNFCNSFIDSVNNAITSTYCTKINVEFDKAKDY